MDTKEVASFLKTSPRVFRQFLRSAYSTFVPVGSGSRYTFTEQELPTIIKRFSEWNRDGKPRPDAKETTAELPPPSPASRNNQLMKDQEVWSEEALDRASKGKPDITSELQQMRTDARLRARVLADAQDAEERLMQLLIANGMHVFQKGDVTARKTR